MFIYVQGVQTDFVSLWNKDCERVEPDFRAQSIREGAQYSIHCEMGIGGLR